MTALECSDSTVAFTMAPRIDQWSSGDWNATVAVQEMRHVGDPHAGDINSLSVGVSTRRSAARRRVTHSSSPAKQSGLVTMETAAAPPLS